VLRKSPAAVKGRVFLLMYPQEGAMFIAVANVNGEIRKSQPVEHVADARALAQRMFAWAQAHGVQLRSVKVERVEAVAPTPPAPPAPTTPKRGRKAARGAA